VPSNAILDNAVFVIDGSNLRKRSVQIGIRGTQQTEILSGLSESERVASPATSTMKDGRRVRAIAPPTKP